MVGGSCRLYARGEAHGKPHSPPLFTLNAFGNKRPNHTFNRNGSHRGAAAAQKVPEQN